MGKVADAHWDAPWTTQEDGGMSEEAGGIRALDTIAALREIAAQIADLNATLKQAFFLRASEDQPDIDESGEPPRDPPEKEWQEE